MTNASVLENARKALEDLAQHAAQRSGRKSPHADLLEQLKPIIVAARAKRHSFRRIAESLKSAGVNVSGETVRRYLETAGSKKRHPRKAICTSSSSLGTAGSVSTSSRTAADRTADDNTTTSTPRRTAPTKNLRDVMPHKQKRAILALKDKGGTGCSTFCMTLWEQLLSTGRDVHAFDLDGTTGSFASRYGLYDDDGKIVEPQPGNGVTPIALHGTEQDRDRLAEIYDIDSDTVLVDFPATALTVMQGIEVDWQFGSALAEAGYSITVVTVCTPFAASLANVNRALDLYPTASHVVVLNSAFGDVPGDFVLWYGDNNDEIPEASAKARVEALGNRAAIITFPALHRRAAVLADKYMLRFSSAVRDTRLTDPMRRRIRTWLSDVAAELRPAAHLLGLE